jgi:hypothetical protein
VVRFPFSYFEGVSGVADIDRVVVAAVGDGVSAVPRATSANRTCQKKDVVPYCSSNVFSYLLHIEELREQKWNYKTKIDYGMRISIIFTFSEFVIVSIS